MVETVANTGIRKAVEDDIDNLTAMATRFLAWSPYGTTVQPTHEGIEAGLRNTLEHGVVFLAENQGELLGALAGRLSAPWFEPGTTVAVELGWWVEPKHRGGAWAVRLLREFETWGRQHGARVICMSDLVTEDGDMSSGDLFERLGYRLVERSHVKEAVKV